MVEGDHKKEEVPIKRNSDLNLGDVKPMSPVVIVKNQGMKFLIVIS